MSKKYVDRTSAYIAYLPLGYLNANQELSDSTITYLVKLSEEKCQKMSQSISEIDIYDVFDSLHSIISENLIAFQENLLYWIDKIQSISIQPNANEIISTFRYDRDINRHFLNYLNSFKTFLDVTNAVFNSHKMIDGLYEEYKRFRTYVHANYPSYRLIEKLRNFAQHYRLPLGGQNGLSYNVSLDQMTNSIVARIDTFIYVEDLLKSGYNEWGASLQKDFITIKQYDLLPTALQSLQAIEVIKAGCINLISKQLFNHAKFIYDSIPRNFNPKGGRLILKHPNTLEGTTFVYDVILVDRINKILKDATDAKLLP